MGRLDALIERWGNLAALLFAAAVLFTGLGATGLWEPWEMSRADIARNLAAPPEAVVALGPADDGTADVVQRAANQVGVVVRRPDPNAQDQQAVLGAAMELARTRLVASIVIDLRLLFPTDAPATANDAAWSSAGQRVSEALRYAGGGSVVLVERPAAPGSAAPPAPSPPRPAMGATELEKRLALERWRALWTSAATTWKLDGLVDKAQLDAALARLAESDPDEKLVHVVTPTDLEGLVAAFDAGARAVSGRVAFKSRGDTVGVPPLESWLRGVAYRALGTTEFATRLPGVLLSLMALWVLLTTLKSLWGARVALMAGVVLATMPLFYAQARVTHGDAGFVLALTLAACGQLLATQKEVPRLLTWAYLIVGLAVGLLSKGVFAGAVIAGLALLGPAVAGARRLGEWAPGVVALAVTGLVLGLVMAGGPDSSLAQLGFGVPRFGADASVPKGFDLVIAQLGFGMNPWSPLVVVAAGAVLWWAAQAQDKKALVLALWFFVPIVAVMAGFRVGNHFFFAAAPAAAALAAVFAERVVRRGVPVYFLATAVVLMYVILRHDLKEYPSAMVSWLTWEQPFAKDGPNRFPETLEVSSGIRWALLVAGVMALAHFARIFTALLKFLNFLRRDEAPAESPTTQSPTTQPTSAEPRTELGKPMVVTIAACLTLAAVLALFFVAQKHGPYMSSRFADVIGPSEKKFVGDLSGFSEPIFLVAICSVVLMVVVGIVKFGFRLDPSPPPAIARFGVPAGAAIWAVTAIVLAASATYPAGYWGEALTSLPSLFGYLGALGFGFLVWRVRERDLFQGVAALVSALAFLLLVRLVRDADFRDAGVGLMVFFGWLGLAVGLVPTIARSSRVFAVVGAVLAVIFATAFIVPLADRWAWLRELSSEPGGFVEVEPFSGELRSILLPSMLLAMLPLLLLFYRALTNTPKVGEKLATGLTRLAAWLERPGTFTVSMALVGVAVTALTLFSFYPSFAINVSQKHIIDSWRDAERGPEPEKRMFKLPFGGADREDSNFYTAGVPEIRDRQTALQVLLGTQDQVVTLETELGTESRLLTGWAAANDKNRDLRRDDSAIRGFVTSATETSITDASKSWGVNSLVGRRLVDISGRTWNITANDATTVNVGPGQRLTFATMPAKNAYYGIDAGSPDPRATAEAPERRALLIPADSLSDINFQWRKLSGGRHLPILDGSSYRVLLATSWLDQDEKQENRLALATFDDKSFAQISDRRLRRVWGNFEDQIQVVGYQLDRNTVSSGQNLKLTVYFKALKTIQKSWKIFIHLDRVGAGGSRIGGDHWPLNPTKHTEENKNCGGCFRTDHWLPGDIVQDTYDVEIPETSSGEYMIYVGFFDPGPDKRLVLKDFDRKYTKNDGQNRLGIGTFNIR